MIREFVRTGELVLLIPALPSIQTRRSMFATDEVAGALGGPWKNQDEATKMGRARAYVDTYISGDLMSVRMPPSKSVRAQLAQLEPASEEAWELRIRDPRPGVRLIGRFAEKDVLIALTVAFRDDLDTPAKWSAEIERCKREWRILFPTFPPLSGIEANDYISNIYCV